MTNGKSLTILLATLVGIILVGAIAFGGMMGGPMMGPGMMYGYTGQGTALGGWGAGLAMGIGWLMMLAFWGVIIVGVVLLARGITGSSSAPPSAEHPLTVLQRRYAAGEIDKETYEQMRQDL